MTRNKGARPKAAHVFSLLLSSCAPSRLPLSIMDNGRALVPFLGYAQYWYRVCMAPNVQVNLGLHRSRARTDCDHDTRHLYSAKLCACIGPMQPLEVTNPHS